MGSRMRRSSPALSRVRIQSRRSVYGNVRLPWCAKKKAKIFQTKNLALVCRQNLHNSTVMRKILKTDDLGAVDLGFAMFQFLPYFYCMGLHKTHPQAIFALFSAT